MKYQILGLVLFLTNPIFSQNFSPFQDTTKEVMLNEIELRGTNNSTIVKEQNTFVRVENLIKNLNGADLITRGNFAQDPIIRSYKNDQINVTLNGMRMFGACTDRMDPITSYAETSNLKKIQLDHGSQAKATSTALGGSVDLELKEATFSTTPIMHGLVGGAYATNTNGFNSFANIEHRRENFGIYVQAAAKKHQNYYAGGREEILYSQYQKINLTTNAAFKISPKEKLKLNFLFDRAQDVGYPSLPMDVGLAEALVGGAHYQNFYSGKRMKSFEGMIYFNHVFHRMDDTKRDHVPIHMDMPGWSNTFGAWFKANSQKIGKHQLNTMLEFYQNFRRAEMTMYPINEVPMFMLTWPDIMKNMLGFGFSDQWLISEKWQLNSSLRVDWNNSFITTDFGKQHLEVFGYDVDHPFNIWTVSAKANALYTINETTFLHANAAFVERAPDGSEQFGFYLYNANDGHDYIGNPDIHKESAWQAEVGVSQHYKQVNWQVTGYVHKIYNYILGITDSTLDPMTIGANGVRVYSNLPYAYLGGIETNVSYNFSHCWEVGLKAQYTYGEDNLQEPLPLISPVKGRLWLQREHHGWFVSTSLQFAGRQNRVNENYGDQPTPGYALWHAKIAKDWKLGKQTLRTEIAANNILDTYYIDHLSWAQVPLPGRNIMARILYEF